MLEEFGVESCRAVGCMSWLLSLVFGVATASNIEVKKLGKLRKSSLHSQADTLRNADELLEMFGRQVTSNDYAFTLVNTLTGREALNAKP